jgi:hypothetical protein
VPLIPRKANENHNDLALVAARLRFAFEVHLLPLAVAVQNSKATNLSVVTGKKAQLLALQQQEQKRAEAAYLISLLSRPNECTYNNDKGNSKSDSKSSNNNILRAAAGATSSATFNTLSLIPGGAPGTNLQFHNSRVASDLINARFNERLRRLFVFFAVQHADKARMRLEEFVFMAKSLMLVTTRGEITALTRVIIASFSFTGLRTDLLTFTDFVSALICVGEAASFDGIIDKEKRLLNFFQHELLKKADDLI